MISPAVLYDVALGKVDGIPSPVKGLNTQTSLAGLGREFAMQLDNWVCQPDAIVSRGGVVNHVTGFADVPKTLMAYSSATARKLFAATNGGIYDVSTAGAVGASVSTIAKGEGVSVNFATSAGQFLYFVNGNDDARYYNGTSWSTSGITGPALTSLFSVETYRQRLYFLQNDFLGFYYLAADSIGGAATAFRIGSLCRKGGYTVAHGTWSIDGGSGPDDHYVLATSEGELVIFRGSDPAAVANWVYVGTYYIGKPMGVNSFAKFGGDLLYLCENGVIPLSGIINSSTRDYSTAMTLRVQPSITNAAALYGANLGWKIHVCPKRALILLNVPISTTQVMQYVYNSFSKGWSTFSGWNARDFIEYNGETYFTTGSVVAKAFTGYADFGANITATCDTAYSSFNTRSQLQPIMVRPIFATSANLTYTVGIAQDFSGNYTESTYIGSSGSVGIWDSGLWDTAIWGGSFNLRRDWLTIAARSGISLSTRFKVESNNASTVLLAIDYKFAEQGLFS